MAAIVRSTYIMDYGSSLLCQLACVCSAYEILYPLILLDCVASYFPRLEGPLMTFKIAAIRANVHQFSLRGN